MGDLFLAEVIYKGAALSFEVTLINLGYSYRASVIIDGIEVIYKPEETGYRTLIKNTRKRAITEKDMDIIDLIEEQLTAWVKFGDLATMM